MLFARRIPSKRKGGKSTYEFVLRWTKGALEDERSLGYFHDEESMNFFLSYMDSVEFRQKRMEEMQSVETYSSQGPQISSAVRAAPEVPVSTIELPPDIRRGEFRSGTKRYGQKKKRKPVDRPKVSGIAKARGLGSGATKRGVKKSDGWIPGLEVQPGETATSEEKE